MPPARTSQPAKNVEAVEEDPSGLETARAYIEDYDFDNVADEDRPTIDQHLNTILDEEKVKPEFHRASKIYDTRTEGKQKRCVRCGGYVGAATRACPYDGETVFFKKGKGKAASQSTGTRTRAPRFTEDEVRNREKAAAAEAERQGREDERKKMRDLVPAVFEFLAPYKQDKAQALQDFDTVAKLVRLSGDLGAARTALIMWGQIDDPQAQQNDHEDDDDQDELEEES